MNERPEHELPNGMPNIPPEEPEPEWATPEEIIADELAHGGRRRTNNQATRINEPPINLPPQPVQSDSGLPFGLEPKQLIASLVVAVIAIFLMSYLGLGNWITKDVFETNINNLTDTMSTMSAQMQASNDKVDAAIQSLPDIIDDIVDENTKGLIGSINNVQNSVDSVKSSVSNQISGLQTQINDIPDYTDQIKVVQNDIQNLNASVENFKTETNTKITTLTDKFETTNSGTKTVASGDITYDIKLLSDSLYISNNSTATGSFKITLKNNTNYDIEDIILTVYVKANMYGDGLTSTLTGESLVWVNGTNQATAAAFWNNGWGLKVKANETKKMFFTYTLKTDPAKINFLNYPGIPYDVDIEID